MGLYNRFCKRFFAAVIVRTTAQANSRADVIRVHLKRSQAGLSQGNSRVISRGCYLR